MSNWDYKPLGTLCSIKTGKKDVNEGSQNGAYPFFTCSKKVHASDSYSFDTEAILIAGNGAVGETKLYRGRFEAYQRTYVLDEFQQDLDFIYYVLRSSLMTELNKVVSGSTMPYIRKGDLERFPVPLPPLPEQKKIAHVLSTVQRAIEAQERIIQSTTELKKALMHKLFTEGTRGEPQKQTEIGPVPESWEVAPLGDSLLVAQYGLSVKGNPEGNYPILRMTNQANGRIVANNLQFVKIGEADFKKFKVESGDILFNRTNSLELVGRTAIHDIKGDFVFASYLIRLRTKEEKLNPFFLNIHFNRDETQAHLKSIATRAVSQSNISATRLKGFAVPLPCIEEQAEIVTQAEALEAKLMTHRRKHESLQDLFRTLLHGLMTAKIRSHYIELQEKEKTCE